MSGRRRVGAAALASFALAAVVVLAAPRASLAASPVEAGWWTRNPTQQAPEGGFAVASAPDGPVTVAALRTDVGAGVAAARLVAEESSGLNRAAATVVVCATSTEWEAGGGGALADAPATTCDGDAVALERDEDTGTWSADVTTLLAGAEGTVALAVVPAPAAGPLAPPFEVTFAPIALEAVPVSTSAPAAPAVDAPARPVPQASTGSPPSSTVRVPERRLAPGATASVAPQTPTAVPPAGAPVEEPVAATTEVGASESAVGPVVGTAFGPAGAADHRTVGRAALFAGISALIGAVVAGASRALRLRSATVGRG